MRRSKKIISFLLCIALIVCLCPTADATGIIFLAVNDSIPLALTSATMPFYANSLLYVPISLFDVAALNIVPLYDSAAGTFTVVSGTRLLTFDLNNSTMTNENGTIFSVQVISRSGTLFIPVIYCAYHFGFGVSTLTSLGGYPVIRFTTGTQVYDDVLFIEKANNLIEYRVAQYLGTDTEAPPSSDEGDSPQKPEDTPDTEPEDEPPEDIAQPAEIYLAFTNAAQMPAACSALESINLKAAFFFTESEILSNSELILQLFAGGHTIGLIADGSETAANEALDRILHTKALCSLVSDDAGENAGIGRKFRWVTEQPSPDKAAQIESIPQLYIVKSEDAAQVLSAFLDAGANLHQLRETTEF